MCESYEHKELGDAVRIGVSLNDPVNLKNSKPIVITLPNRVKLSFGDIVALGGDYFGINESIIKDNPEPVAATTKRFEKAFDTLYKDMNVVELLFFREILKQQVNQGKTIRSLCAVVLGMLTMTPPPSHLLNYPFFQIQFPRLLTLALSNLDHFSEGDYARRCYEIGHNLAIETYKKDPNKALAIEAYAAHFLTDMFSAGHIRTRRKTMNQLCGSLAGSFDCYWQHKEDGEEGLHVENNLGNQWKAYGDGKIAEKEIIVRAVQAGVNEVCGMAHLNELNGRRVTPFDFLPKEMEALNFPPLLDIKTDGKIALRDGKPLSPASVTATLFHHKVAKPMAKAAGESIMEGAKHVADAVGLTMPFLSPVRPSLRS